MAIVIVKFAFTALRAGDDKPKIVHKHRRALSAQHLWKEADEPNPSLSVQNPQQIRSDPVLPPGSQQQLSTRPGPCSSELT
jgi:hypothetical protein